MSDPVHDPAGDPASLEPGFFERFYAASARPEDPWGFTDRWYERRKRAATLAALPRERFGRAFEPGCSVGVQSVELAARCDALLCTDVADAPLAAARARLDAAGAAHAVVERRRVPQQWPAGTFDLVVLSEVGYYCGPDDLAELAARAVGSLAPDGVLLACHWRHPVADYPLSGDDVHAALRARTPAGRLDVLVEHVEEDFLLHVLVPPPATSVARAGGLV